MKNLLLVIVCVLLIAGTAGADVYGPVPNYNGTQQASSDTTIPTTGTWNVYNPLTGETMQFGGWGGQTYTVFYPTPMFVESFIEVNPYYPTTYSMTLTEVCTYNLQPGLPSGIPNQRGFTAGAGREVSMPRSCFFAGKSGTHYSADTVEQCPVSNLSSRLPGYDLGKIATSPPENVVYIVQKTIDPTLVDNFMGKFEFTMDYGGYTTGPDPCMPYVHSFTLNIQNWDPAVPKVSDIDWQAPHIVPGYVTIVTPSNWQNPGGTYGRVGFEANAGAEIGIGTGSFGWTVKAKTPYIEPGHAYLTQGGQLCSPVIKTVVVGANAATDCGVWGHLIADLNSDCYVNFQDFAIFAGQWLQCTKPDGTGCTQPTIVGLGIIYDQEETTGPAVIQDLYDTHVSGLYPGDKIVKFCGISISNGASLFTATQTLPPLTAGQTIPVTVVRSGTVLDLSTTVVVIPLADTNVSFDNKDCTQIALTTPSTGTTCTCSTGTSVCSCFYTHQPNYISWRYGMVRGVQVRKICADQAGRTCEGGIWLGLI